MGALIFLLLITTRRIQKQALVELPTVSIEAPVEVVDPLPQLPEIPDLPLTVKKPNTIDPEQPIAPLLAPISEEDVAWERRRWEQEQEQLRAEHLRSLNERNQLQQKLDSEFAARIESLRTQIEDKTREISQRLAAVSELKAELERQKKAVIVNEVRLQKIRDVLAEIEKDEQLQIAARNQMVTESIELTRQIARAEENLSGATAATEIVAYDTMTGTAKKPILIECTEKEIRFVSEGIALSAMELSGFPPEYNPLRSGAEALLDYWERNGTGIDKPYLLLVVRPGGTTGFYVARGLLSKLDHDFGYELVSEETQLNWPETDPGAAAACERAVRQVLSEREHVAARTGYGLIRSDGPLDFADTDGSFSLPAMKNASKSRGGMYLGDEKWVSPHRRDRSFVEKVPLGEQVRPSTPSSAAAGRPYGSATQPLTLKPLSPSPNVSQRESIASSPTTEERPDARRSSLGLSDAESSLLSRSNSPGRRGEAEATETRERTQPQTVIRGRSSRSSDNADEQSSGTNTQSVGRLPEIVPDQPPSLLPNVASRPIDSSSTGNSSSSQFTAGPGGEEEDSPLSIPWTIPRRRGAIGIERQIAIHLRPELISVEDELDIDIPLEATSGQIQRAVTRAVRQHTQSWKSAPDSFFWKPTVKIVIHPGGNQHYARVKDLTNQWGTPTVAEYSLD
ncbi:hypothetical protein KOR42_36610 [Thalassoglobus neptunius]|uniref:Uncharacterized protein n=2 Tax=Thalassoglobus neptunius TaxID=1938619 RepID=A0A5C5WH38_9PLAN|nr:hypothetical protein KOR42_36610 [Thalassoglobus neptunius]